MIRQTLHYTGRVQGVGFRATTVQIARHHDVTGYVQNLPDGRVRLVVEGSREAVEQFTADVAARLDRNIQRVQVDPTEATGEFDDFSVKY